MFDVASLLRPDFSSGRSNLSAQEVDSNEALEDGLRVRGDCFISQPACRQAGKWASQ